MKDTIKSGVEFERLFEYGKPYRTRYVSARIINTPEGRDQRGRVAFIAGKRIGNAVYRNRCRRVMREMYYRSHGPWNGFDVAFIANRNTATATRKQLDESCERIVSACLTNPSWGRRVSGLGTFLRTSPSCLFCSTEGAYPRWPQPAADSIRPVPNMH